MKRSQTKANRLSTSSEPLISLPSRSRRQRKRVASKKRRAVLKHDLRQSENG